MKNRIFAVLIAAVIAGAALPVSAATVEFNTRVVSWCGSGQSDGFIIVTSVSELNALMSPPFDPLSVPRWQEVDEMLAAYTDEFFADKYLVTFIRVFCGTYPAQSVAEVRRDGTIVNQRVLTCGGGPAVIIPELTIIELSRDFQVSEFRHTYRDVREYCDWELCSVCIANPRTGAALGLVTVVIAGIAAAAFRRKRGKI
jgi:hypothetical protein